MRDVPWHRSSEGGRRRPSQLAAEQDYTRAQYNLGVMYAQGLGVPRNGVEAVRWYRKVALKGLAQAQYNMGVRHAQGKGAPMDFIAGLRLVEPCCCPVS